MSGDEVIDGAGGDEVVEAELDEPGLEGEQAPAEEGEANEAVAPETAAEGREEDAQGVDLEWLAGVTGVSAERLATLEPEQLRELGEAVVRAAAEAEAEAQAEAAHRDRVTAFAQGFAHETGRDAGEVERMLEDYEALMAAYEGVQDPHAYRRVQLMAWNEVQQRYPEPVKQRAKDPGRIRKPGAHNGPVGFAGKRRVSLEGRV